MKHFALVIIIVALALPAAAGRRKQFEATEDTFRCLLDWPKVRNTRVFNAKPKKLRKAMRILEKSKPRRRFPKGTIIQLVPFEAMVKRGGGFNKEGRGWEFFRLEVSPEGTTIVQRGGPEVVNILTGNPSSCQGCHADAKKFDFVCEKSHGCVELGLPDIVFETLQNADPRCPPPAE